MHGSWFTQKKKKIEKKPLVSHTFAVAAHIPQNHGNENHIYKQDGRVCICVTTFFFKPIYFLRFTLKLFSFSFLFGNRKH
ncbi:hypothetical protein PAMP_021532 [Pampus punctatissimus]